MCCGAYYRKQKKRKNSGGSGGGRSNSNSNSNSSGEIVVDVKKISKKTRKPRRNVCITPGKT